MEEWRLHDSPSLIAVFDSDERIEAPSIYTDDGKHLACEVLWGKKMTNPQQGWTGSIRPITLLCGPSTPVWR